MSMNRKIQIKNSPFVIISMMVLIVFLLTSCGSGRLHKVGKRINRTAPDKSKYYQEDLVAMESEKIEKSSGSLWVDSYHSNLYANMYRASKIGDTVTVVISEEAVGKRDTKTKTKRKSEVETKVDALGGLMNKLQGLFTAINPAKLISASAESKFDGQGKIDSKGSLFAQITCTVNKKLKNGNMFIRGEKRIKVYEEEQILILEGMIRPYDILPNNTVSSIHIADARISYTGFGVIAEKQRPGWLSRVLDYVWPF